MATNFNLSTQAVPLGGTAYDPVLRAISSLQPMGMGGTSQAASLAAAETYRDNLLRYHPLFNQQNRTQEALGLINTLAGKFGGGGGGGAPALGDFESMFNRIKDPLLASLAPGEERARQTIKNRLLAEGGAGALSSGQGMSALSTLEGELGANRQGLLAKALQDTLANLTTQRGQDVQLAAAQAQNRFSMLNSLFGPLFASMFQQ